MAVLIGLCFVVSVSSTLIRYNVTLGGYMLFLMALPIVCPPVTLLNLLAYALAKRLVVPSDLTRTPVVRRLAMVAGVLSGCTFPIGLWVSLGTADGAMFSNAKIPLVVSLFAGVGISLIVPVAFRNIGLFSHD